MKINVAALLTVVQAQFPTVQVQQITGWVRLNGIKDRRVIVALNGSRVDLSHFTHPLAVPAETQYKRPSTALCPQVLDLNKPEQEVYRDLFTIMRDGLVSDSPACSQVSSQRASRGSAKQTPEQVEQKAAELLKLLPDIA